MLSAPFFLGLWEVCSALSYAPPELTLDAPCERRFPGLSLLPPPLWAPLDQSESQRHVPVYRNHVPLDDCCAARGLAVYPKPEASFVGRPAPSFPQPLGSRVKEVLGTPRALREACWTADNGGARWRWPPPLSPITAAHLVIIMNAVGFWVAFLAHPINGLPVVSTWTRSVRSTSAPATAPAITPAPGLRAARASSETDC